MKHYHMLPNPIQFYKKMFDNNAHVCSTLNLGLFLGTTSHYLFSANTICIVHLSTQPIHTKAGPIAVPWCTVLTQAWHVPLPLEGWHYAFIQTKVGKALSCYMALLRSNKLNILIKYSQLLWSGVEFFKSMWLKKIFNSQNPAVTE